MRLLIKRDEPDSVPESWRRDAAAIFATFEGLAATTLFPYDLISVEYVVDSGLYLAYQRAQTALGEQKTTEALAFYGNSESVIEKIRTDGFQKGAVWASSTPCTASLHASRHPNLKGDLRALETIEYQMLACRIVALNPQEQCDVGVRGRASERIYHVNQPNRCLPLFVLTIRLKPVAHNPSATIEPL